MTKRRVVVTGIGVVSPIGVNVEEFWQNALAAKTNVSRIPESWFIYSDYKSKIWSVLPEFDYLEWGINRLDRLQYDPVSLLGICAAREALINSGRTISIHNKRANTFITNDPDSDRCGVYMGTGIGGAKSFLENYTHQVLSRKIKELEELAKDVKPVESGRLMQRSLDHLVHAPRFNPLVVSMLMPNSTSASIGIKFSLKGPNNTFSMACAAGTVSIGHAFRSIRSGQIDVALAGGCEYLDDKYGGIFRGFDAARTLATTPGPPELANRPFDTKRSGFLYSQGGAAVLVLEELNAATKRKAPIVAEVLGYGETFDAYSLMGMESEGQGIQKMINLAIGDANVKTEDITYINAHGTGTVINDDVECRVVSKVFGNKIAINSTKSLLGHTMGASGALEAAITALSLKYGTTHICKNLENPISNLNFVREVKSQNFELALSQSFAFGGHNAGIVMRRFRE